MLYLYVNETYIKKQTNPVKVNGISYSNPTDETLLALGYLPLVEKEVLPEKEGYWVSPKYIKESDKILNVWQYVEVTEDELA